MFILDLPAVRGNNPFTKIAIRHKHGPFRFRFRKTIVLSVQLQFRDPLLLSVQIEVK
jgi:hypothetical protein